MARPEINIGSGTEYIGNTRVVVVPKFKKRHFYHPAVSDTARHEAKHSAVKPEIVKLATIVPGPGYLGKVETCTFDPTVAMASFDEAGNGHDRMITRMLGYDESSYASAASNDLSKKKHHVYAIAYALDQKKTLTGPEIRDIIRLVDEEKKKPLLKKADIYISDTNGGQRKIENVPLNGVTVMVPGEWALLPVPAKPDLSQVRDSDTGSGPDEKKDLPWDWGI